MKKPIIGITMNYIQRDGFYRLDINEANLKAVIDNGGIPLMLSFTDDEAIINTYIDIMDGMYFSGGNDIAPVYFNEDPIKELGNSTPERDEFEIKIYKKARNKNIPIIGICRGHQLINVAAGGTVYQDIYSQRQAANGHSPHNIDETHPYHKVKICDNSILMELYKANEISTNSLHHQAVKDVAPGFKATAYASDGIIEAVEYEDSSSFILGIQWHPELMYKKYPEFNKIFEIFIRKAEEYSKHK